MHDPDPTATFSRTNRLTSKLIARQKTRSLRLKEMCFDGRQLEFPTVKAGMDAKTARKYLRLAQVPSELLRGGWRTRPDPFAEVWAEIRDLLQVNAGLEAKTVTRPVPATICCQFHEREFCECSQRSSARRRARFSRESPAQTRKCDRPKSS